MLFRPMPPPNQSTPDDTSWTQIRALFESALELLGEERQSFLQSQCGSNQELRREVDALLDDYEETGDFLETPLVRVKSLVETNWPETGSPEMAAPVSGDRLTGTRIGAYRLEREIGRGGMGAVYLASRADSEFDKRVAIKLIRDGAENALAIRRFRHERQILARLENPYIARLIDGGTTESGSPYFVMEYVEGQPVNQFCETRSLTTRDRLHLFLKICSAVQYAHERHIIHRDLKPGNILVKEDGTPKLLDFGIAKILAGDPSAANPEATIQGFRMVTPAYASPEQNRGDAATIRSDIYSLGVVLYELLCGERPGLNTFQRNCLVEGGKEAHLSANLRAILFSSIRLDPDERYPSIDALAADIRRYLSGAPPLAAAPELLETQEATEKISLAILPFRIVGEQVSRKPFLASGITEALIARLSRIERLSIPSTSSVLKYRDGIEAVRAARELHVQYILEGSLHDFGDRVRATVQLVFAEAGIAVWAAQIDNAEEDILKLEDSIAEQVAGAMVPHLTGEERAELSKSGTSSGAAHEAYLRGRWHWSHSSGNQEHLAKALVCFMEAIAIDPKYAKAHAGLADYYLRLGLWGGVPPSESFAAALQSARTAIELEPGLGEAHASLAFATWAYLRDESATEQHFKLAAIRNPGYASAHHWFGLFDSARNRPELAIANLERAQKVDPNSAVIAAALGFVYYNARQFGTALRLLLDAARELPKSAVLQEMLTWCHLQTGDVPKALETGRRAVDLSDRSPAALSALAHAEQAIGRSSAAAELSAEIEALATKRYVSGYDRASAFLAIGRTQDALRCLEQALAQRDWWVSWLGVDPRWDQLRHLRRFRKLLPGRARAQQSNFRNAVLALACLLLLFTGVAVWWTTKQSVAPFSKTRFTKLTTKGTADSAVISPDGRTVVYTAIEGGGTGIWRRDMASGRAVRLVSGLSETVGDLAITQGGTVAFTTFPSKQPANRELYTLPLSGGAPTHIPGPFPGRVGLTRDGHWAAFYKSNLTANVDELWTLNIQSGERRLVTSFKYPERFARTAGPAWSPDGKQIAYAAEQRDKDGFLVRLYVIEIATGTPRLVASPRWQWVQSLAWIGDQSALAAVGQESESSFQQVWYLPLARKNAAHRISNDLDSYIGVSLTTLSSELVSVQAQTLSNIFVLRPGNLSHPVQITPGNGRYFDLSWMSDGRILYASDATGSADLWMMKADGNEERPVISGVGRNYAPISTPDAKSIAFHSNRSGNWQVWRADVDGSHQRQLSTGARDGNWPQFTNDGQFVLFHQTGLNGVFNLWRVPSAGGTATQITKSVTMHPAVSRVDGRIAAWYSETTEDPHWKLAIFAPEGGEPLRIFNPPADAKPDTLLRWTPKGDAISFLNYPDGHSNIWLQPVDGSPARSLTSFTTEDIYSFDWSRDGALVYSRGLTTQDVVLIRDLNALAKAGNE